MNKHMNKYPVTSLGDFGDNSVTWVGPLQMRAFVLKILSLPMIIRFSSRAGSDPPTLTTACEAIVPALYYCHGGMLRMKADLFITPKRLFRQGLPILRVVDDVDD